MFYDRVAKFPDRIKNLYFLYAFVLRAVSKLSPYLAEYPYNLRDGNEQQKLKVSHIRSRLIRIHRKRSIFNFIHLIINSDYSINFILRVWWIIFKRLRTRAPWHSMNLRCSRYVSYYRNDIILVIILDLGTYNTNTYIWVLLMIFIRVTRTSRSHSSNSSNNISAILALF